MRPLLLCLCLLSACAAHNPYYDPNSAHRREDGFVNNYVASIDNSFWQLLKWRWQSRGLPHEPAGGYHFPVVVTDPQDLAANGQRIRYTWIGHATGLLQLRGVNVLTDPMFSQRASPVQWLGPQRKTALPIQLAQLPHIDLVVISHNHYDHLDLASVQALDRQAGGPPLFLVPLGVKPWMLAQGIQRVEELDWWQQQQVAGLNVTFVPSQHWSARSLWDKRQTLWGGWVVQAPDFSFYFAGDTGYSQDFKDIGARFGGFDLSAIPVGAYQPTWFMGRQHVDPDQAVQIHQDVKSRLSVGVHWGTFELTDEPLQQVQTDLAQARTQHQVPSERFILMQHGETRVLKD